MYCYWVGKVGSCIDYIMFTHQQNRETCTDAKDKQSFDWLSPSFSYHPCVFVGVGLHWLGSRLGRLDWLGPYRDSMTIKPLLYQGVMIGRVQMAINPCQTMVPEH